MIYENINRLEVINHKDKIGRAYVKKDDNMLVELEFQDDGKTLKIFLSDKSNGK